MLHTVWQSLRTWLGRPAAPRPQIDEAQWHRAESRLPFLDYLDTDARQRLRRRTAEFLAQKQFHGAQGLVLDDHMLLVIALQACLPVLHLGLQHYRDWVGIIVYPGQFVVPRREIDDDGLVHEFDDELLGEAWQDGPVLLSWTDDEPGGEAAAGMGLDESEEQEDAEDGEYGEEYDDGVNVVIHEFAHKLDMANGGANGMPPLWPDMDAAQWSAVFGAAYASFCDQVDHQHETVLDPYAAEHPAEFFAVASEAFFETPGLLQHAFPAVYDQLQQLYRVDPAAGERAIFGADGVDLSMRWVQEPPPA